MSFPTLFKSVIKSPVPWRCNFWDFLVPSIKTNQNLAKLFLPWNVRFLKTTSWGPLPFWLWEFVRFSFSFFFFAVWFARCTCLHACRILLCTIQACFRLYVICLSYFQLFNLCTYSSGPTSIWFLKNKVSLVILLGNKLLQLQAWL